MNQTAGYLEDLAYVHDQGFGGFARGTAPGLLRLLREAGIRDGLVVDLGCGSGIWMRELVHAGYRAVGVDLSPAMIELARRRVPEAKLHIESIARFAIPPCAAITALGEVFNYRLDPQLSTAAVKRVVRRAYEALAPGGLFILDIAMPGRCQGRQQAFTEGPDWTCLVEYQHDPLRNRLARRIITFRRVGQMYRRSEDLHCQQLLEASAMAASFEAVGFEVQIVSQFGEYALPEHVAGLVASKPKR